MHVLLDISHARHEQYCRRRVARPPRPKACLSCRKTKSKCNFRLPCSRCAARQVLCTYQKDVNSSVSLPLPDHATNLQSVARVDEVGNIQTDTTADREPIVGLHSRVSTSALNFGLVHDNRSPNDQTTAASITEDSLGLMVNSGHSFAVNFSVSLSIVVEPQISARTANSLVYPSETFMSNSLRQHIMYILRSYPLMLTRPDSLPPFIHIWGCGRHFDGRETAPAHDHSSVGFGPLHPLAACISIAHMFNSRTPNSDEFIWRTIESEQRQIVDQVCRIVCTPANNLSLAPSTPVLARSDHS